jgi:hypothetical protein
VGIWVWCQKIAWHEDLECRTYQRLWHRLSEPRGCSGFFVPMFCGTGCFRRFLLFWHAEWWRGVRFCFRMWGFAVPQNHPSQNNSIQKRSFRKVGVWVWCQKMVWHDI